MPLHLTSSNRFESLLDALLAHLSRPGPSPFAPDRVIVPSMAVRRRIELETADRFGICANVEFSFLAQWLWSEIARIVPGVEPTSPFAPGRLAWRIFRILGERAFTEAHAPLAGYLAHADELMRYELATRIAALFDQYITYRLDWLAQWSEQRLVTPSVGAAAFAHQPWQAALWRRIAAELGTARRHPSEAFFAAIRDGSAEAQASALPACAHVFCLPGIAPLYLRLLRELARWTELHVYMLNPCEAYWQEIVAPRRLAELRVRRKADYHEVGNRLLAQWGAQTKAHLRLTLEAWEGAASEHSDYIPNFADTVLAHVQQAMLDLTDLAPGSLAALAADDRSIEIHVCHSLAREIEVLHDQLLAMFAADGSLRPCDVLVVTPALEDAAPLIEAVFSNAPEARHIPVTITGRARSVQSVAARALLDVLALASSRFAASAVFDLLQQPIVGRRFGIDGAGLDRIRGWIGDAGIRWGIDARHRKGFGVPALATHSFEDGLHRLFLGYALPSAAQDPVGPWLATGAAEGSHALVLGCFSQAVRTLERLQRELAAPRPAARWLTTLSTLLDTVLAPDEAEQDDVREVQQALRALHADMSAGAGAAPIPLEVVRTALAAALDDPVRGGVPGGGVTFASMTSLRSLPYRVVCAIGLGDGAFPSLDRPLEFDLIAAAPRPGDRQRRGEDRNVFLDLVLAARERLVLSYSGRDIRDNTSKPPSVLVDDLLEALVPAIATDPRSAAALEAARRRLVVVHPLQAFSPDYFRVDGDARMRSFHDEYCDALKHRLAGPVALAPVERIEDPEDDDEAVREPAVAFLRKPLPAPEADWRVVTRDRLARFFRNPCRFLLQERLGVVLPEGEAELEDDEPFVADWPARSALANRLLPALLQGRDADSAAAMARAGVEYPAGRYGRHLLDTELARLAAYAGEVTRARAAETLPPVHATVELAVDGETWRLEGDFGDLRAGGLVRFRYDDTRAGDYLDGWLEHLLLCAARLPDDVARRTVWLSRDGRFVLEPVQDAASVLQALLALYAEGLRAPLHFYPRTSWCYATTTSANRAASAWYTTRYHRFGEDRDAAYRIALRGIANPLDGAFERCATTVFGPLLAVIDDQRLKS